MLHATRLDKLNEPDEPDKLALLTFTSEIRIIHPTMSNKTKQSPSISLDNLPDLLTIKEVSDLLRVSPLTIKRWGKKGKLPAIRINSRGDRRYTKEVILELLNRPVVKEE